MIGGNITGILQLKTTQKNELHEAVPTWESVYWLKGWLDLMSNNTGASDSTYNAKIQDSTHIFLSDYQKLSAITDDWLWDDIRFDSHYIIWEGSDKSAIDLTSDNARFLIDGNVYQIKHIDDPMGMHKHFEIYLKYVGGGLGG